MPDEIVKIKEPYLIRDLTFRVCRNAKGRVKRVEIISFGIKNPPEDPKKKVYRILKTK